MNLSLIPHDWRDVWSDSNTREPVGAVFTKAEVVDLILDLAGYCSGKERLATRSVLEPSCGDGAFLRAVLQRLIDSEEQSDSAEWEDSRLDDAIRAVDINLESVLAARRLVFESLTTAGCPAERASTLSVKWVVQADFLLAEWGHRFDFVVGNPPYVRIEDLPRRVLDAYRNCFATLTDRADLYVAFYEKGLELLSATGTLAYISANRFAKNTYGAALRRLISERYHVRAFINLEHTQPFEQEVSAYPAIVVIDRRVGTPTLAGTLQDLSHQSLDGVRETSHSDVMQEFATWFPAGEPWTTTSLAEHSHLSGLTRRFPALEESAPTTKVGIGVATGADSVFVLKEKHRVIEESRQIPLLMASNVSNEGLHWSGRFLLNPFADCDDGSLAPLVEFPGMAEYLSKHADKLLRRHVARSRPSSWYRTIDRVWPRLRSQPKLVIPDMQGAAVIGYDTGEYYPHHNLYWITSDTWPLRALKTLLRSSMVYQQVKAYSVQMRGGTVRFQAQTLRRVRIPELRTIPRSLLDQLEGLAESTDQSEIDDAAKDTFGLAHLPSHLQVGS